MDVFVVCYADEYAYTHQIALQLLFNYNKTSIYTYKNSNTIQIYFI